MTTHRRAWVRRAGVVVALTACALLTLPTQPALAEISINNVSASPSTITVGGTTRVTYSLKFTGPVPSSANVRVTSNNPSLGCTDGCNQESVDGEGPFTATFTLSADLASSGPATITITATETSPGGQPRSTSTQVMLVARPKVQTVREVSGKVVDQATGDGVSGALVMLRDGQGRNFETTTGSSGAFRFTGSEERPIAPGDITIGASKGDVRKANSFTATAGQSITGQRLALALAPAQPTATPSATPEVTEDPMAEESLEPTESAAPQPQAAGNESTDEGGGMGSWLLIIAGALLVALGVGAIVLLWLRRREGDPDRDDPVGAAAASGGYSDDRTRVVPRAGAGPAAAGVSLADAPTMMHRPVVDDEFPDPYGAPLPAQQPRGPQSSGFDAEPGWAGSGYGGGTGAPTQIYGAAGGYGNAPASGGGGYGNAPASGGGGYGNAPASGGGYGSGRGGAGYGGDQPDRGYGGYGGDSGYGANTPGSGAGYGGSAPGAGGYGGDGSGYGSAPASGGGGYGNAPAPASGGGYGSGRGGAGYGGDQPDRGYGGYGDRYDEPTGRYDAGRDGDYGRGADPYSPGTYGQAPGGGADRGYGTDRGYGAGDDRGYPTGGYDQGQGQGYGAQGDRGGYGPGSGGYGPASGGGYADQGGYRDGYDQPGGYGQRGDGYDGRGYDQQGGGYYGEPPQGGRPQSGPPQQSDRGERRQLGWLDD